MKSRGHEAPSSAPHYAYPQHYHQQQQYAVEPAPRSDNHRKRQRPHSLCFSSCWRALFFFGLGYVCPSPLFGGCGGSSSSSDGSGNQRFQEKLEAASKTIERLQVELKQKGCSSPLPPATAISSSTAPVTLEQFKAENEQLKMENQHLRREVQVQKDSYNNKKHPKRSNAFSGRDKMSKSASSSTLVQENLIEQDDGECNLSTNLEHLRLDRVKYPRQDVGGPLQADAMLSLFAMIRASSMTRILEIGAFNGESSFNFLQALRCKDPKKAVVYSIDWKAEMHTWETHPVRHKTILKDESDTTISLAEDLDGLPVDMILITGKSYSQMQRMIKLLLGQHLLSDTGILVLHDTGLHPLNAYRHSRIHPQENPPGMVHQSVERLMAQWIVSQDCSFQRLSLHDDNRRYLRHGLTILQRRVNLDVNYCTKAAYGRADLSPEDCETVQVHARQQLAQTCPVDKTW